MQVMKFGGTSVADSGNIRRVIQIVGQSLSTDRTMVVVSAMGGVTDLLIEAGQLAAGHHLKYKEKLKAIRSRHLRVHEELLAGDLHKNLKETIEQRFSELASILEAVYLLRELSPRTQDSIVSLGELLSSMIISAAFELARVPNEWVDAREIIRTDAAHGGAAVEQEKTRDAIIDLIGRSQSRLFIVPGFIAADNKGVTTTLGRGGSDYTAAILAAATGASKLEIWTDVSGMMTADPRTVSNAKAIPFISYQEAMELSHFGAKVIYPPTIQPVMKAGIPLWIRNTFQPDDHGTLMERSVSENMNTVRGISSIGRIALISLEGSGMVGIPGFSKRLFGALSDEKINVILITQSSSEHSICAAIDEVNVRKAKSAVDKEFSIEITAGRVEPLRVEHGLSIIALVGDNMKNHSGISGKMFGAMGRNNVNIRAIAQGSSEKNISAVISTSDEKKAVNVLHEEFFETAYRQVNLFIIGVGNVGSRLMDQLSDRQKFLIEQLRLQIRVVGVANSRKMLLVEEGIELADWKAALDQGIPINLQDFMAFIGERNMRNAVFIDVTSNDEVAALYPHLLRKSVAVVACNKIATSSSYESYEQLKNLAREFNTSYLFETNVGASLPIIGTLNDLVRSGDKVNKIEAVLSGTLNFVFNNYDGSIPFAAIVKQAQDEGYAEPDPRIDLSGKDVMRKILILAREAGYRLEMSDIRSHSFLPGSCMQGDVPAFYREMEKHEDHFRGLYRNAAEKGCKLKFVASLENGKASVGLQQIGSDHDLFHLYGKDNVVLFYTNRYSQQPMVIKGAGAGAEVTASGIFADIVRAARFQL